MSSAVAPVALNASTITSVIMPTACLNTSRPSIRRWPTVWVEDGPPSTNNFDLCRPSERRCVVNMPRSVGLPGWSCASSTTAPAPSPNSTQVRAGAQEIVGGRQRKDEAGAYSLQVEGDAMVDAKRILDRNRGRRKGVVRRRGRQHDQIDLLCVDASMVEGGARGV